MSNDRENNPNSESASTRFTPSPAILSAATKLRASFKDKDEFAEIARALLRMHGGGATKFNEIEDSYKDAVLDALNDALVDQGAKPDIESDDIDQDAASGTGARSGETEDGTLADPEPEAPKPKSTKYTIDRLCSDWVWVVEVDRFVRIRDGRMWTVKQFDSRYNHLLTAGSSLAAAIFKTEYKVGAQGQWFSGIKRLERICFRPGKPPINGNAFNLWRRSAIEPKRGDSTLWNEHLKYLFPDSTDRDHVLNWMAWVLQNPSKKPNHALLIIGKNTGTGKSFIARVFEQLIGTDNTQRPKNSSLKGDFNGWALRCKLCLIEELMQIGKREVANELRDIITEPTIEVNIKNVPAQLIENYMAMMAISNHADALPADDTERRWLVVSTPVERREPEYYSRLMALLDSPRALQAIAYELQTRKLGNYNGAVAAPETDARQAMIAATDAAHPYKGWLLEQDFSDRKLLNIQIDIFEGLGVPEYVLDSREYVANKLGVATAYVRDALGGKNLRGSNGKSYTFTGLDGKERKGALWAINGSYAEFSTMAPASVVRSYLDMKQAGADRDGVADIATARERKAAAERQAKEDFGA